MRAARTAAGRRALGAAAASGVKHMAFRFIVGDSPASALRRLSRLWEAERRKLGMVGRQPFGGNRRSGTGAKAGGPDYLLRFVEPRVLTESTVRHGLVVE